MSKYISYNKGQYKVGYLTNKSKGGKAVPSDNTNKKQKVGDEHTGPQTQAEAPPTQSSGESHYAIDDIDLQEQEGVEVQDVEMQGGDQHTSTRQANTEGHHALLQKGVYTGTLQEGDIWTKKKMQTADYQSVRKFERVFRWCHEYQYSLSGPSIALTYPPRELPTPYDGNTYPNGEVQMDYIVANCIDPSTKWFVDDMVNWYTHFYNYMRLQKLEYEIVFENRLVDPLRYIHDSCRYTSSSFTPITSNTVRGNGEIAWRWGPWDVYQSTFATPNAFPTADVEAQDIREQMQAIGSPMQDRFMIWRDINGNMIDEITKKPYGARYYDNQNYPGHGMAGVTVEELKDPVKHINRRQVEHFDSGVKMGNSIKFSRTLHVDGPFAYTGDKIRNFLTNKQSLSSFIKLLEINPNPPLNMTSIPEFFHFYFVPMNDYPMYQMKNADISANQFSIQRFILPFETVAHITAKADYCFFQRVPLSQNLTPGTVALPRTIHTALTDLEIYRKWEQYEIDHSKPNSGTNYIVTPSQILPVKELVEPLIPTDQMGHMYLDMQ